MNDRYYIDKLTYHLNEVVIYDNKDYEIVHIHKDGSGVNLKLTSVKLLKDFVYNVPFMFLYKKKVIMDTYSIKYPYLENRVMENDFIELEIVSQNLIYSEIGKTHFGLQCLNVDNDDVIREKCKQVADLIREIDKLNRVLPTLVSEARSENS
jgi:hypothetical protein